MLDALSYCWMDKHHQNCHYSQMICCSCGLILVLQHLYLPQELLVLIIQGKYFEDADILEHKKQTLPYLSNGCLLYTSPSPRDGLLSRMPSSA